MSDKQTTAVVLLVILSLIFWLYNQGRLSQVVASVTGSPVGQSTQAGLTQTSLVLSGLTVPTSYSTGGINTQGYVLNAVYGSPNNSAGTNVINYGASANSTSNLASLASSGAAIATLFG